MSNAYRKTVEDTAIERVLTDEHVKASVNKNLSEMFLKMLNQTWICKEASQADCCLSVAVLNDTLLYLANS